METSQWEDQDLIRGALGAPELEMRLAHPSGQMVMGGIMLLN